MSTVSACRCQGPQLVLVKLLPVLRVEAQAYVAEVVADCVCLPIIDPATLFLTATLLCPWMVPASSPGEHFHRYR
jgi:hypothetical protein